MTDLDLSSMTVEQLYDLQTKVKAAQLSLKDEAIEAARAEWKTESEKLRAKHREESAELLKSIEMKHGVSFGAESERVKYKLYDTGQVVICAKDGRGKLPSWATVRGVTQWSDIATLGQLVA